MSEKEDPEKQPEENAPLDDDALERLAVEELMREAVQGAARAEIVGPSGWVKAKKPKTNKRFLVNTLRNTIASNKYYSDKSRSHSRSSRGSPRRDNGPEPSIKKDRIRRKH